MDVDLYVSSLQEHLQRIGRGCRVDCVDHCIINPDIDWMYIGHVVDPFRHSTGWKVRVSWNFCDLWTGR